MAAELHLPQKFLMVVISVKAPDSTRHVPLENNMVGFESNFVQVGFNLVSQPVLVSRGHFPPFFCSSEVNVKTKTKAAPPQRCVIVLPLMDCSALCMACYG